MESLLDLFLHIDEHLNSLILTYQAWTYVILFLVIFMETGVVVTPFLPGDSLLFAAGALTVGENPPLNVILLFLLLFTAAVLGDTVNYQIGKKIGPRVFKRDYRFLKREHLERTQQFYHKHGGKTIVMARFIPIIRTFAPFIAGVGNMTYSRFLGYNVFGGFIWTAIFIFAGHFFGNIPFVKENFEFVVIAIILISILPVIVEFIRGRRRKGAVSPMVAGEE